MPTIVISITGGNETPVEEYEHSEDGSSCPVATRDPELNEENRETAVEEADYRDPSDDGGFRSDEVCGNCGAYDQTPEMLACIGDDSGDLGYCQTFRFSCMAEHTCNRWIAGGPITSLAKENHNETF